MKYNELLLQRQRKARRAGRGVAAGRGKTAGRGTKGQGARKSGGVRPGFEGGQMPLYMRLPHLRGFKSKRQATETTYTGQLSKVKDSTIDNRSAHAAGLVSSPHTKVKLILKGELSVKKGVKLQSASKAAIEAIEKASGSFERVNQIGRPKKGSDKISAAT